MKDKADRLAFQITRAAGFQPSALLAYIRRTSPYQKQRIAALETETATIPSIPARPDSEFHAIQERVRSLTAPPRTAPSLHPIYRRREAIP